MNNARSRRGPSPLEAAINSIVITQSGLVTYRQLRTAGLSADAIGHRLDVGRLIDVFNGVYLVAPRAFDQPSLLRAALLLGGDLSAAAGASGAVARGLISAEPGFVTVATSRQLPKIVRSLVPVDGHRGTFGTVRFLRSTLLQRGADRSTALEHAGGFRTTTVPRMLVDVAATRPELLDQVWREAEFRQLIDRRRLDAELRNHRRKGNVAVRALMRKHLEIDAGEHGFDTIVEMDAVQQLLRSGVPQPLVNHWVVACGKRRRLDLFFPLERLAVEVDGWEGHRNRDSFEDDPVRDSDLRTIGIATARFTARKVQKDPEFFISRVKFELAERRQYLAALAA